MDDPPASGPPLGHTTTLIQTLRWIPNLHSPLLPSPPHSLKDKNDNIERTYERASHSLTIQFELLFHHLDEKLPILASCDGQMVKRADMT